MSSGEDEKQWSCGKAGAVNLQKVGSIVRDIGEPCLSQSPIKVVIAVLTLDSIMGQLSRMLKPDKWQAIFDTDGKGVDPAIRPEVWEFLLGCYALDSTAEYRRQLRTARRLRISDAPETPLLNAASQGGARGDDKVSEWLWTLHRIVVDVVRTDSHLEFYEDKTNLARMSDILAVYAWVDPATGYCQGMSDCCLLLLSSLRMMLMHFGVLRCF
ncbi:hypothetical protein GH714_005303 [Hevea brasiliensis]|uniref:Rab-GAP TBC domain-containing protein n=1 Tax=Hevea brasiliensis TaxID=3981 RepID=A0A6A6N9K9_HEVBR|nr:hypothetical protein GH714_005303 [Hevea brasiliensis]